MRLSEDALLITPSGVSKGFMDPRTICRINLAGEVLEGEGKPSSEAAMHIEIYRARPDVKAVVHAHPPYSTGFAVAGKPLRSCALPEAMVSLGSIALVPYATPAAGEIPRVIAPFLPAHDAFLLSNHGAVTVGTDLMHAYYRMETLEHFAQIVTVARSLGGERLLSADRVKRLLQMREQMGFSARCDSCHPCELE